MQTYYNYVGKLHFNCTNLNSLIIIYYIYYLSPPKLHAITFKQTLISANKMQRIYLDLIYLFLYVMTQFMYTSVHILLFILYRNQGSC